MQNRVVILFISLVGLLGLYASPAQAAPDCDRLIVDETGKVNDLPKVEAAINRLVTAGAVVRVRFIPKASDFGNLDRWKKQMQNDCPSWQSADGHMKNNLVVMAFSMDHKSGLYFGDEFRKALDERWLTITTDRINPRFRDGEFVNGIVNGLDAVRELILAARAPAPQPAPASAPPIIINTTPAAPPSPPADLSGLWTVLKIGLGLGLLVFIFMMISSVLRENWRRRAAQQKAQSQRTACAGRIAELDEQMSLTGARLAKATKDFGEDATAEAKRLFTDLEKTVQRVVAQYGDVSSTNNADKPNLSVDEYRAMEQAFDESLSELEKIRAKRTGIQDSLTGLQTVVDEAQQSIKKLTDAIEPAAKEIADAQELGLKTDAAEADLVAAMAARDKAQGELERRQYTHVKASCKLGTESVKQAKSKAKTLVERRQYCTNSIAALKGRLAQVRTCIENGRATFLEITVLYAQSSLETIRGNGTEAEKRFGFATKAVEEAERCCAPETQDWAKSETFAGKASNALNEAESIIRSIATLKETLAQAKQDAPTEVSAAQADILEASAYIKRFDDDIDDALWGDLKRAQDTLDEAKAELAKSLPDYLAVVRQARNAHTAADKALEKGRNEHQAAERTRSRAVSSLRDARAAYATATEYFEDREKDIGKSAKNTLEEAKKTLDLASKTEDLVQRIKHAEASEELTGTALRKAKSDVSSAAQQRREAKASREAARSYTPSYTAPSPTYSRRNSDDDGGEAFLGGLAGGLLGSSLGSSSRGRDRESNSDWGSRSSSRDSDSGSGGGGGSLFDWSSGSGDGGGGSSDTGGSSDGGGGSSDW